MRAPEPFVRLQQHVVAERVAPNDAVPADLVIDAGAVIAGNDVVLIDRRHVTVGPDALAVIVVNAIAPPDHVARAASAAHDLGASGIVCGIEAPGIVVVQLIVLDEDVVARPAGDTEAPVMVDMVPAHDLIGVDLDADIAAEDLVVFHDTAVADGQAADRKLVVRDRIAHDEALYALTAVFRGPAIDADRVDVVAGHDATA